MSNVDDNDPQSNKVLSPVEALPMLAIPDRQSKVWALKIRGVGVPQIAAALGVSDATVYTDLREIGRRYRDELLDYDPVELIASNLQFLDEMERIALLEVNQSEATVTTEKDEKTGLVKTTRTPDPNKGRFYQSALKARELKLNLLMSTGIIPKNKVELFDKLSSAAGIGKTDSDTNVERTDEEIKESIDRLMKYGRFMHEVKETPPEFHG